MKFFKEDYLTERVARESMKGLSLLRLKATTLDTDKIGSAVKKVIETAEPSFIVSNIEVTTHLITPNKYYCCPQVHIDVSYPRIEGFNIFAHIREIFENEDFTTRVSEGVILGHKEGLRRCRALFKISYYRTTSSEPPLDTQEKLRRLKFAVEAWSPARRMYKFPLRECEFFDDEIFDTSVVKNQIEKVGEAEAYGETLDVEKVEFGIVFNLDVDDKDVDRFAGLKDLMIKEATSIMTPILHKIARQPNSPDERCRKEPQIEYMGFAKEVD